MTTQSKLVAETRDPENGYQRRRRETRRLLMQAGRSLFAERAADQVSIERITERAGVAKGSFYNHFKSRDELFEEIIEDALTELLARFEDFEPPIDDLLESALARARFAFHTLLSDPEVCRLLLQGGQPTPGGPIDRALRSMLGNRLAWGISLGSLKHIDPELVYAAYFGAVTETIGNLLTREEPMDVDTAADQLTELVFAVLGLPHHTPPRNVPGGP